MTIANRAKLLQTKARQLEEQLAKLKQMDDLEEPAEQTLNEGYGSGYNSEEDRVVLSSAVRKFEKFQKWR